MPRMTVTISHRVYDTIDVDVPDDSKDPEEDAMDKVQEMIDSRELKYRDIDWEEGDDGIQVDDVFPAL